MTQYPSPQPPAPQDTKENSPQPKPQQLGGLDDSDEVPLVRLKRGPKHHHLHHQHQQIEERVEATEGHEKDRSVHDKSHDEDRVGLRKKKRRHSLVEDSEQQVPFAADFQGTASGNGNGHRGKREGRRGSERKEEEKKSLSTQKGNNFFLLFFFFE